MPVAVQLPPRTLSALLELPLSKYPWGQTSLTAASLPVSASAESAATLQLLHFLIFMGVTTMRGFMQQRDIHSVSVLSSAQRSSVCKTWPDQDQVGHLISLAGWNWCNSCAAVQERASAQGPSRAAEARAAAHECCASRDAVKATTELVSSPA